MDTAGHTARFGAGEVGTIGMDTEYHFGWEEGEGSVGLSGGVAKEAVHFGYSSRSRVGLEGGEGSNSG